jgi:hypothetical protein
MTPVKLVLGVDADACSGAQVSASVGGVKRAPFMQQRPPVIIFTPLSLPPAWNATRVCVTLRAPCPELARLCYGSPHCWYALLQAEAGNSCCVVDTL